MSGGAGLGEGLGIARGQIHWRGHRFYVQQTWGVDALYPISTTSTSLTGWHCSSIPCCLPFQARSSFEHVLGRSVAATHGAVAEEIVATTPSTELMALKVSVEA